MSTRSLTIFVDCSYADGFEDEIVVMYRHCDGNLLEHGLDICKFLLSNMIDNGAKIRIGTDMPGLAADMIAHFVTTVGGIYLYPYGTREADQVFNYWIYMLPEGELLIKIENRINDIMQTIYEGSVKECYEVINLELE